MGKKIFSLLLLLILAGMLIACTHKVPKQFPPATASSLNPSSRVSPSFSAVNSSGEPGNAVSTSPQDQDLRKILNNVNSIGNSADSLDKADSSDLVMPDD